MFFVFFFLVKQLSKSFYSCRNICQWCHRFLFIGTCTIQVVFINQWILCKCLLKLLVHCVRLDLVETKVILGASLGADCGSDHQFLITKFRLKLKKTGENTRPARHDLNKITYELTVEVMNRFKGLDLITVYLNNYGQMSIILYKRQWTKQSQRKRNTGRQSGYLRRLYRYLKKEEK